ncbi:MAG: hypothetical protein KatS3mg109_0648 [Pirellulaceae bacterium]|nr:MAG: hypothetical protein KatS3mg109_0648 [Pirellulaceae bacterium]
MPSQGYGDPRFPEAVQHQPRPEHKVAGIDEGQVLAQEPAQHPVLAVVDAGRVAAADLFKTRAAVSDVVWQRHVRTPTG